MFKRQLSRVVERKKLPAKRSGFAQKAKIGGQTVFVRTGEYDDNTLGEIFIDLHKEGASFRSGQLFCHCRLHRALGGVPLEEFADKFTFTRFEPSGPVDHPNIKFSTSIVDYVFRLLAFEYLDRQTCSRGTGRDRRSLRWICHQKHEASIQKPHAKKSGTGSSGSGEKQQAQRRSGICCQQDPMGDAPPCHKCGHTTIRNGTCYKCLNCGERAAADPIMNTINKPVTR